MSKTCVKRTDCRKRVNRDEAHWDGDGGKAKIKNS